MIHDMKDAEANTGLLVSNYWTNDKCSSTATESESVDGVISRTLLWVGEPEDVTFTEDNSTSGVERRLLDD